MESDRRCICDIKQQQQLQMQSISEEEEDCEECGSSYMEEEEEGGDDFEEMLRGRRRKHSYVDNGEETPDEMGEEKKSCEKCGKEMCECGGGMYESKKKTIRLSETELTKMIAKMVSESIPGLDAAKKSHTESGKENKANIASVEKKIADFRFISKFSGPIYNTWWHTDFVDPIF